MKQLRVNPTPLDTGALLSAMTALFSLTLRQHARGRRLWVVGFLFLIPTALAVLIRLFTAEPQPASLELQLVLVLIPQTLLPLMALLYASGMIQDEIDEQTMTYLLIRPLPRWSIYLIKLLSTWLLASILGGVFTTLTYVAIYAGGPDFWSDVVMSKIPLAIGAFTLALLGYCALFGCLSLLTRYTLIIGIGYIILFEGLLANIEYEIRRLTVMYYLRVLELRWLKPEETDWGINLDKAPSSLMCVLVLVLVSLAATALALSLFRRQEFRVKTPGTD